MMAIAIASTGLLRALEWLEIKTKSTADHSG
jgi:hypothetical protein